MKSNHPEEKDIMHSGGRNTNARVTLKENYLQHLVLVALHICKLKPTVI
jgi:hypothetical protein